MAQKKHHSSLVLIKAWRRLQIRALTQSFFHHGRHSCRRRIAYQKSSPQSAKNARISALVLPMLPNPSPLERVRSSCRLMLNGSHQSMECLLDRPWFAPARADQRTRPRRPCACRVRSPADWPSPQQNRQLQLPVQLWFCTGVLSLRFAVARVQRFAVCTQHPGLITVPSVSSPWRMAQHVRGSGLMAVRSIGMQ
jgi:hypothetical protein